MTHSCGMVSGIEVVRTVNIGLLLGDFSGDALIAGMYILAEVDLLGDIYYCNNQQLCNVLTEGADHSYWWCYYYLWPQY